MRFPFLFFFIGDSVNQAEAIERFIPLKLHILTSVENLQPTVAKPLRDPLDKHINWILSPEGLLSNLLDPRYRGRSLPPAERRAAIALLLKRQANFDPDTLLKELDFFERGQGTFGSLPHIESVGACAFWQRLFRDSPLAAPGATFGGLPSSAASIERIWSAAGYQSLGRERLTVVNLFKELYVKINF